MKRVFKIDITAIVSIVFVVCCVINVLVGYTKYISYVPKALTFFMVCTLFFALFTNKKRLQYKDLILFSFILYLLFNVVFIASDKSAPTIVQYMIPFICGFILLFTRITPSYLRFIAFVFFLGALFEAATVIISVFVPGFILNVFGSLYSQVRVTTILKELSSGKYSGILGEKALAAYLMNIGIAYAASKIGFADKKKKIFFSFSIGLLLVALLLTGKRTLFLCASIIVVISIFSMYSSYRSKLKMGVVLTLIIVLLFVVITFVPEAAVTMDRFADTESYGTMNGRMDLWEETLSLFKKYPLLGIGYGSFKHVTGNVFDAHNSYLQLLCEIGIVGFAFFLSIVVILAHDLLSALKKGKSFAKEYALFVFIITIVYAFTGNVFHSYNQIIPFFLALTLYNNENMECFYGPK